MTDHDFETTTIDEEDSPSASLLIVNWKAYHSIEDTLHFIKEVEAKETFPSHFLYIALPLHFLSASHEICKDRIIFGANQLLNIDPGSFTANAAIEIIKDAGGKFVLLGTQEQRTIFHETNQSIAVKINEVLKENLLPFVCIGETLEEFKEGKSAEALKIQLQECFTNIPEDNTKKIVVIYEAPWINYIAPEQLAVTTEKQYDLLHSLIDELFNSKLKGQIITATQLSNHVSDYELLKSHNLKGFYLKNAAAQPTLMQTCIEIFGQSALENKEKPIVLIEFSHVSAEDSKNDDELQQTFIAEKKESISSIEQEEPHQEQGEATQAPLNQELMEITSSLTQELEQVESQETITSSPTLSSDASIEEEFSKEENMSYSEIADESSTLIPHTSSMEPSKPSSQALDESENEIPAEEKLPNTLEKIPEIPENVASAVTISSPSSEQSLEHFEISSSPQKTSQEPQEIKENETQEEAPSLKELLEQQQGDAESLKKQQDALTEELRPIEIEIPVWDHSHDVKYVIDPDAKRPS